MDEVKSGRLLNNQEGSELPSWLFIKNEKSNALIIQHRSI